MRRKDREIKDINHILKIISDSKILTLSMFDGEYPYAVPMHFGYEYKNGSLVFYMHSAKEGHKIDLINNNPNVCISLRCNVELVPGNDGLPCSYGSAYASVFAQGKARIIEESEEKIKALKLLMQNQTGREFEFDEAMAERVSVIRVDVSTLTAKSRPIS